MSEAKRRLVAPGELLPPDTVANTPYVITDESGRKIAAVAGLLDLRGEKPSFIPLQGAYVPSKGDIVIGLVVSQGILSWTVDINSPYTAVLTASDFLGRPFNPLTDDMSKLLQVGDYIKARVEAFDRSRNPMLSVQGEGLGRIVDGKVIDVAPSRVPRLIGKKHSMVNMIREETGCDIYVAVNGRVHVKCSNPVSEAIAVLAIKKIEREAHTTGLTERIRRFIEEEKKVRGV